MPNLKRKQKKNNRLSTNLFPYKSVLETIALNSFGFVAGLSKPEKLDFSPRSFFMDTLETKQCSILYNIRSRKNTMQYFRNQFSYDHAVNMLSSDIKQAYAVKNLAQSLIFITFA